MKLKSIVFAACAVVSLGAHAGLVTYAPWDAALADRGLAGVLFNVQSGVGGTLALGAHAYKNGVYLPSDGIGTFYAAPGTYAGPPAEPNRANWSFDFAWSLACRSCTVFLGIDTDPSAAVEFSYIQLATGGTNVPGVSNPESWNLEMPFLTAAYDFNPYTTSSTAFRLEIRDGNQVLVGSDITVDVPEPGSLALAGLALFGLAFMRRRA